MSAFLNTYLPWGILAITFIICFYVNIIDTGRQRGSTDPFEFVSNRQLEFALIIGIVAGAILCYSVLPIPVLWGVAIGAVGGLVVGLFRRKNGK